MTLSIERYATSDQGTQSNWRIDGAAAWVGIELPWRNDAEDVSCIPAGTYKAVVLPSKHFHKPLYHLLAVPKRKDIEIHSGNYAGDVAKGFRSDVKGCAMVGHSFGHLYGCNQLALIASRMALSELMAVAKWQPLDVVVSWKCESPEVGT